MRIFVQFLLLTICFNTAFTQPTKEIRVIDSIVTIINSMKLKTDSLGFLSSNPLITGYTICYYDEEKTIYKIKVVTNVNSPDTNKIRDIATGTNVYYFRGGTTIKSEGQLYLNAKPFSGAVYYGPEREWWGTIFHNDLIRVAFSKEQAMQHYYYYQKHI